MSSWPSWRNRSGTFTGIRASTGSSIPDAPVDPENLRSLEEFAQLPILTKDEIRREQEEHPPYGRFLCIPPAEVFRVHGTSGTTGPSHGFRHWARRLGPHSGGPRPHPLGRRPPARRHGDGGCGVQPLRRQLGGAGGRGTAGRHLLSLWQRRAGTDRAGRRVVRHGQTLRPVRHTVLRPVPR